MAEIRLGWRKFAGWGRGREGGGRGAGEVGTEGARKGGVSKFGG